MSTLLLITDESDTITLDMSKDEAFLMAGYMSEYSQKAVSFGMSEGALSDKYKVTIKPVNGNSLEYTFKCKEHGAWADVGKMRLTSDDGLQGILTKLKAETRILSRDLGYI